MEYLSVILLSVFSGIIVLELTAHNSRLCVWIINIAASRVPEPMRSQLKEEWLAHLHDMSSPTMRLYHALGCFKGSYEVAHLWRTEQLASRDQEAQLTSEIGEKRTQDFEEATKEFVKLRNKLAHDIGNSRLQQDDWLFHSPDLYKNLFASLSSDIEKHPELLERIEAAYSMNHRYRGDWSRYTHLLKSTEIKYPDEQSDDD